jgi:hypothetical protein
MDRHLAVRYALGLAVAAAGIIAVTAVIWVLGGLFPPQRWAGCTYSRYWPVASKFGFMPALMTAALPALVFDFLFFPPFFSLALKNRQDPMIVLISAVTAGIVSVLAKRARQRTREVKTLAREQAALRRDRHTGDPSRPAGGGVCGGLRGGWAADGMRVDDAVPVRLGRRGDRHRRARLPAP